MTRPEELSDDERKRLTAELAQIEEQQAEALEEGFRLGGGLGNHEYRAGLEERAETLRRQLGHASAQPPRNTAAGCGWVGWAILALACVAVVVTLWLVGGGLS